MNTIIHQLCTEGMIFHCITGTIPDSIRNLQNLRELYLSGNNFDGKNFDPAPKINESRKLTRSLILHTGGFDNICYIDGLSNVSGIWEAFEVPSEVENRAVRDILAYLRAQLEESSQPLL